MIVECLYSIYEKSDVPGRNMGLWVVETNRRFIECLHDPAKVQH